MIAKAAALYLLVAHLAVAQVPETSIPSNCEKTIWQTEDSPDRTWKANSFRVVCDLGLSSSASAIVEIFHRRDANLRKVVLGMDLPSDPADRPHIRWVSPAKLAITVATGSTFGLRVAEYQGIQVDVNYCPDDPKLNQDMLEWRARYRKWIQDTTVWTEKKNADPMFRDPKPALPPPPERPSSCESSEAPN